MYINSIFILFKQYLFLTFVPKARGLSRELMLQKIQRFFRTSVRHKHTVRKEKNKTKLLQYLKINSIVGRFARKYKNFG